MVAKANKDGFAKNKDIKKGFYTFTQAWDYANATYKLVNQRFIYEGIKNEEIDFKNPV